MIQIKFIGRAFICIIIIFLNIFSSYAEDNLNVYSIGNSQYLLDNSIKKSWFDITPIKFSNENENFTIIQKKNDTSFNSQLKGWGLMVNSYFDLINFDSAKFSLGLFGCLGTLNFALTNSTENNVNKFRHFYDRENFILGLNAYMNYFFTQNTLIHMDYNFLSLGSVEDLFFKYENNDYYKMDLKNKLSVGIKLSI